MADLITEGVVRQIRIRPGLFIFQNGGVVTRPIIVASGLLLWGFFTSSGATVAGQREGTLVAAFSRFDGAVEALSSLESTEEFLIKLSPYLEEEMNEYYGGLLRDGGISPDGLKQDCGVFRFRGCFESDFEISTLEQASGTMTLGCVRLTGPALGGGVAQKDLVFHRRGGEWRFVISNQRSFLGTQTPPPLTEVRECLSPR
jgi:hypothetical protein